MYRQIYKWLYIFLWLILTMQIKYLDAINCTALNFFSFEIVDCKPDQPYCCGWVFSQTCCTKQEKNQFDNVKNIVCRIIIVTIVVGIILIFIAFLIGWIYSCYLIAKQLQNSEENENIQTEQNENLSLIYSFFTRYIDTVSPRRISTTNDNLLTSSFNDKPPTYSSLFKVNISDSSINENQSSRNSLSNSSILINTNNILEESLPPPYPGNIA